MDGVPGPKPLPAATPPAPPVAPLPLAGSADQAAQAYLSASPSAMAATQGELAGRMQMKLVGEAREDAAATPPLKAEAVGAAAPPVVAPSLPGAVPAAPAAAEVAGPAPQDALATPAPAAAQTNDAQNRALAQVPTGSVLDVFKSWLQGIITRISTRDPGLSTKAGRAGKVALTGGADPGRAEAEAQRAQASAAQAQARQEAQFRAHPGQARIQPQPIRATAPVPRAAPVPPVTQAEPDPHMADYARAPLPPDVRAATDRILAPGIAQKLAAQKTKIAGATARRDQDRAARIATAQAQARGTVAAADGQQRARILADRKRIAAEQGKGIATARAQLAGLKQDTAGESGRVRSGITTLTAREETRAQGALTAGETKADAERRKGESEARQLKAGLAAKKSSKGFWSRVKSAVTSAVRAVTNAIDKVFTRVRKAVAGILEAARKAAVGILNAAARAVTGVLNKFRKWVTSKITQYLGSIAPGLARRINGVINGITDAAIRGVKAVARAAVKAVNALARGLAKALDKVLSVFQTALTTGLKVAGALVTGDFKGALRAAIEGACQIAGVDPKSVFRLIDKAGKAIAPILKDPVGFLGNLFRSVGQGVRNFLGNIGKHLISGVIGWLTGALTTAGIEGPFSFTPRGIGKLVLQVLGVTYANIRARVIQRFPAAERVLDTIERSVAFVKTLIVKGPMALWEQITQTVGNLKSMVLGAIRKFLAIEVIKQGILWLLSFLNPASALVKVVKAIFDLVQTVIARLQQIRAFAETIWSAVKAVVAQNFKAVTKRVEQMLARGIPILISLIAGILGLNGITDRVAGILRRVSAPVNKVVARVVDRIVKLARKLVAKGKAGVKAAKTKVKKAAKALLKWWRQRHPFKDAQGKDHHVFFQGQQRNATPYVASNDPRPIKTFLADRLTKARAGGTSYTEAQVTQATTYFTTHVEPWAAKLATADPTPPNDRKASELAKAVAQLAKHSKHLARTFLRRFFDASDALDWPPPRLPVMTDSVKAKTFTADYIVTTAAKAEYRNKIAPGTESGKHTGDLEGWSVLQGAKMTTGGQKYVRMHLLPHLLGGNAVDSNLTPARGDRHNTPFSHAVEQPAIKAARHDDPSRPAPPIWYDVKIRYHANSGAPPAFWMGPPGDYPATAFPKQIQASWGYYKPRAAGKKIARGSAQGTLSHNPRKPRIEHDPPSVNDNAPTQLLRALQASSATKVTMHFVKNHLIANQKYSTRGEVLSKLHASIATTPPFRKQHAEYVHVVFTAIVKKRDKSNPASKTYVVLK